MMSLLVLEMCFFCCHADKAQANAMIVILVFVGAVREAPSWLFWMAATQ
jgi:hypothetical protein